MAFAWGVQQRTGNSGWRELLSRVRGWLKPDGRFFMHIFTHRSGSYLFDRNDHEDWIAQHFFTGGVILAII
jgi:cyclopropane-fatty-acyl-phospholipid synthase